MIEFYGYVHRISGSGTIEVWGIYTHSQYTIDLRALIYLYEWDNSTLANKKL